MAAGRARSPATRTTCCFRFLKKAASLPAVVVLPAPLRPQSRMRRGRFGVISGVSLQKQAMSSSCTIFTNCSPGRMLASTSAPSDFFFTSSQKSFATW